MTSRRHFLGRTALGTTAALLAGSPLGTAASSRSSVSQEMSAAPLVAPAAVPLTILVLGGTGFIGPHQIEYALARGHRITMFNRGNDPGLYGDRVEELTGDRDVRKGTGLTSLAGERRWDVVIDNSGYVPRHVRDSVELLKDRCGRYVYTSTVAVYDFDAAPNVDRDGPLLAAPAPEVENVTWETYGPLKAECDRIVQRILGERATIVRPTYIVGPGDTTDRFTYWIERLMRGGDVVCPAYPQRRVQWIDVRDLCPFLVHLAENGTPGAFNAVGPASPVTNAEAMQGLRAFCAAPTELLWPSAGLLDELEYPTPMFDRSRGDHLAGASHAIAAGLTYRSLADTVRDTHAWWLEQSDERRARARGWPSAEAEAAVVARLRR
ncbi:NAD dependent epimerase/dehydratase family protein [Planctomycetes bacterium Pla163]|uniref:NAD dependent epimerase/dehydratase family protein n=1 Tax=Rohdeia mirabilis TaxID=2528008 RepID=A0A518CVA5_9BACT|nr:NAD dependent epimerase/dehydratase family protein [Planctomycetes bacterium Pla163]